MTDRNVVNSSQQLQNEPSAEMTFIDHLEELRRRLIWSIVAVATGSTGCYFFAADLIRIITLPAGKLYFMSPAEAFFSYIKISLFSGFLLALPVVLYQAWAFIVPAMTKQEKKVAVLIVPASVILFLAGLAFSYFFVLPLAVQFFIGFATQDLQPLFSLGNYLSFVISFLLPFGFVFELPLFIVGMAKFGLIGTDYLIAKRKIVIVLSFVIGGIVTPPDVFSQVMLAVPLIILYEVSILVVKYLLDK